MVDAYFLLLAMNGIKEEQISAARALLEGGAKPRRFRSGARRALLIAAVLVGLLAVTACSAILFSMSQRRAEPEESFAVSFRSGEQLVTGQWQAGLVLEFQGAEECAAVHFKPGWLPFPVEKNHPYPIEEGWYTTLVSEHVPDTERPEDLQGKTQAFMATVYYAPQFADGGALLVLDQSPGQVEEETWGALQVLKYHTAHTDPEGREQENNYLILFSPAEGWIIAVRGLANMETLEHIARELEVEPTGETVKSSDFQNKYAFMDVVVG